MCVCMCVCSGVNMLCTYIYIYVSLNIHARELVLAGFVICKVLKLDKGVLKQFAECLTFRLGPGARCLSLAPAPLLLTRTHDSARICSDLLC